MGGGCPLNQTRNGILGAFFPSVGALVVLIGVGGSTIARAATPWLEVSNGPSPVSAPDPRRSAEAEGEGVDEAPRAGVDPVKVHGTITVDFEKVTIAELLRLTQTLEQVDGVIHIVSADRGGGGDDRAVVTISRPDAPALVLGESGAVARIQSQLPAYPPASTARERSSATAFPRLASLGRMLGFNQRHQGGGDHPGGPTTVTWEPRAIDIGSEGVMRTSHDAAPFEPLPARELESAELEPSPPTTAKALEDDAPAEVSDAPAADSAAGPQAQASDRPRRHVATADDSFESLSRSFYGDARYARALWWANRGDVAWPGALAEGKRIVIPSPGELEPRMIVSPDPVELATSPKPKPRPTEARYDPNVQPASFTQSAQAGDQDQDRARDREEGGFSIHVVRPDDTLRAIAREVCGDERKALEIIALNRDILTPEGRIRVGQRLLLPAAEKPEP